MSFMEEIVIPKGTMPSDILHMLESSFRLVSPLSDYTYVILGKVGPTGKTSLCNMLRSLGCNAHEITPVIHRYVEYTTDGNHCWVDNYNKAITIMLNEKIK
jgi:hypothetical protein